MGGFNYALLDSRDVLPGDGPAKNVIYELKLAAARQWLHFDFAVAELAVTAGLLLVAALDVGGTADGFTVRDFRGLECDINVIAALEARDHHLILLLACPAEQEFVRLRVAVESQRRVLFQN